MSLMTRTCARRRRTTSAGPAALVVLGLLGSLGLLGACDPGNGGASGPDGQDGFVQPVPSLIAARADGDRLELWTGTPCDDVTEIELTLDPGAAEPVAVVDYVAREPRTLDRFELGSAPAGFTARAPLPDGVSWRDADDVLVVLTLPAGMRSVTVDLGPAIEEATGEEYLLGDELRTESEILAGDGGDYALVCSPDPTASSPGT